MYPMNTVCVYCSYQHGAYVVCCQQSIGHGHVCEKVWQQVDLPDALAPPNKGGGMAVHLQVLALGYSVGRVEEMHPAGARGSGGGGSSRLITRQLVRIYTPGTAVEGLLAVRWHKDVLCAGAGSTSSKGAGSQLHHASIEKM